MASPPPEPRFVVTLAVLGVVFVAAVLFGAPDVMVWLKGQLARPTARAAAAAGAVPPAPAVPRKIAVTVEGLGRSPVARFAFDPAVAGRVVACEAESRDGGRTWPPLEPEPIRRAMVLGGPKAAPPAAGPAGRILCGDVILPGRHGPTGLDAIQLAAEWSGSEWRTVGLPVAGSTGDTTLDAAVAYDTQGTPIVVRGDRLVTPAGELALPGRAEAFALDGTGAMYAAIASATRRPALMWAEGLGGPWADVPSPGRVKALAADGTRAWAVADMFGRGSGGKWDWVRWPVEITPEGVTGRGTVVVVWGGPKYSNAYVRGQLLISRDGGATLGYVPLDRIRPVWAVLDPHRADELLVLGDDQSLSRVRF